MAASRLVRFALLATALALGAAMAAPVTAASGDKASPGRFKLDVADFPAHWQHLPAKKVKITAPAKLKPLADKVGAALYGIVNVHFTRAGAKVQVNALAVEDASEAPQVFARLVGLVGEHNRVLRVGDHVLEVIGARDAAVELVAAIEAKGYTVAQRSWDGR